ncbi:uncharacterized protein LOC124354265 [Homalodisca vitripennis]|uniref:uncharacterized protein LOC124354265 n=1 Tax=Homalodisca vitripennis TaxID=197043 RepID=UPI001EEAB53A|nr:uncharacterized protein LOC124354265 [Homalodisca vitripennis]
MKNSLLRKVLPFQTGLIGSALIMFGILTISTSYQNASTFQLRLVIICWFLFTLLFTTALTSSIVTRLTLPLYTRRVDSVQQLVEGGYYWTQPDYHNRRATLSEFYFDLHNTWHQQFENRYTYIEQQQIEEQLNKNHNLVFLSQRWGDWVILQNVDLRNEKQLLGNFRVMRGSTRYAYTSFSFRKRFSFNKLFTRTIQQFLDHGLWAFWVRKFTGEDYTRKQLLAEKDVQEFNQPERLTLAKLHPVFYLLLIGLSFSSLVFSIEYCYFNS